MKRVLSVFIAMLLIAGTIGTVGAQAQKRYKFVVITHATAVPFFVPVRKGA